MKIQMQNVTIRDLTNGYQDDGEGGVTGYNGRLNIRPAYQREFIYGKNEREDVIHSIRKGFPLNSIYWAHADDEKFELLDGQQRTISICQYVTGIWSVSWDNIDRYFGGLSPENKERILNYELSVYVCDGSPDDKLDWFRIINIAGEKLTPQELRNAVYTGPWLADAKKWFSQTGCPAYAISNKLVKGSPIRQEILEKAIHWVSASQDMTIKEYMARNQDEDDAGILWSEFQKIINWVNTIFPDYYREMKGIDWGTLYYSNINENLNPVQLKAEVKRLMADEDVTRKKGIFEYLLTNELKHLNIRKFNEGDKRTKLTEQGNKCASCGKSLKFEDAEADHITPWSRGGRTELKNCQILCKDCNRRKNNI